jgi:hypothetical protein
MRHVLAFVIIAAMASPAFAQARKPAVPPRRTPAPPAAALKKIAPEITCPAPLGLGVKTKVSFCEVLSGRDPAGGLIIQIPPHKGPATLTFDLHNIQTYSEEEVKAHRAFTRLTATIGVLTMDNTLLSRGVVQSEFRAAADLLDRVGGGTGPGGVKAVAPAGREPIVVAIPESELAVSLLGEKLTEERIDRAPTTYSQSGRPIAAVSNVMLEYRPGPPPKPAKPTAAGRKR